MKAHLFVTKDLVFSGKNTDFAVYTLIFMKRNAILKLFAPKNIILHQNISYF